MQIEQRDVNTEIIERLERMEAILNDVKTEAEITNGRVTVLETYVAKHEPWSQDGRKIIAGLDAKLDRLSIDVISRVSATLQAMVHDALNSAMREDFATLYREEAESDRLERRKERREDMKSLLTRTQKVALYFAPFFLLMNFIGQWLNWW
jgi:hypothetical protein